MLRSVALVCLVVALCGVGTAATAEAPVVVTEDAASKTVHLRRSATLEVRLATTPGTGYSWSIARNDPTLLAPLGGARLESSMSKLPGAPGAVSFVFRAQRRGQDAPRLEYRRPWIHSGLPARTFALTVAVGR
ncbi:MAG: protease inhibitor I42 family protein [Vulcanimicrobiaceae bacterium]